MIEKCKTCINGYPSVSCVNCGTGLRNFRPYKPPTNAARMRGASDKELAAALHKAFCDGVIYSIQATNGDWSGAMKDSDYLDWLRQPAEMEVAE